MAVETGTADAAALPPAAEQGDEPPGRGEHLLDRLVESVPALVVLACCGFVAWQMRPDLLLRDTTASGGDMAAHVWFPAYLRDHLLGQWRLAGWSPDWYAGFPAGQFYFPVPALGVLALDVLLPYNVAFKLVTAAGAVALPAAAYACARGLRIRMPAPVLCAPAAVAFLFFKGDPGTSDAAVNRAFNQGIMGGTLRSTLAGEFSFTIALALALCFVGALAVALRDRKRLWLPAVLLGGVVLCHVVVGIFAAVAGVVVWMFHRPTRTLVLAVAIGVTGALLTAVWSFPLLASFGYTANMRYQKITEYVTYLFPTYFWWVFVLAAIAIVAGARRRDRGVFVILTVAVVFALVFRVWPEAHAWNLRFLPFWYLGLFLLAGIGAAELAHGARWVVDWVTADPDVADPGVADRDGADPEGEGAGVAPPAAGRLAAPGTVPRVFAPPPQRTRLGVAVAALVVLLLAATTLVRTDQTKRFLAFWVDWNYSGYEDTGGAASSTHRPKRWPEFRRLLDELRDLPPGRALWEGGGAIDAYGSSLALMMLPYFTDGRIASMEGLYYESSATTPYHFMAAATLAGPGNASNPVRGLQYGSIADFDLGVEYLRRLGVRYYLAHSEEAKDRAAGAAGLRPVATVEDRDDVAPDGWEVYEVLDAPLVEPLAFEPVVATGIEGGAQSECFDLPPPERVAGQPATADPELTPWECLAAPWWDTRDALDRPLVASGPDGWVRVPARRAADAPRTELPPMRVTNVRSRDDSVSFDVSRTGVPVVVKVSSYPNWELTGATGPHRATPNFMVVVPTSRHVELRYERTPAEWLGAAGSIAGLGALAALVVVGRRRPEDASVDR